MARELRFDGGRWRPIGVRVSVYNVCDYALLASQQIICHFHEDTGSYVTIGDQPHWSDRRRPEDHRVNVEVDRSLERQPRNEPRFDVVAAGR